MSRLIVVSNRVPSPKAPATGGLAVALKSALEVHGGVWLGWSGKSCGTEDPPPFEQHQVGRITYALTDLSERDLKEYYLGFANSVLWPLCHYRLGLTDYARQDAEGYYRVNDLFADQLVRLIAPDDVIWVHDYHLLPLAAALRARGVKNRVGFFMHIPWPAPDVFLTLPGGKRLLTEMTAYDLIGFQTEPDAENFALGLKRSSLARALPEKGRFATATRRFEVGAYPISIDTANFTKAAQSKVVNPTLRRLRDSLGRQKLIVGVDRLDYTKGIPQRIEGYQRYLDAHPSAIGQVSYVQITPKSRSDVDQYEALEREIAELAGHLAGRHGRLDWTPMSYVNRAFSQNILAGLYRMAQVGLVTPLRDGMNLVAKEYAAAQDPEDPGVLVLSRFAGAALELGDNALLVNPYDVDSIAAAIHRAIEMPLAERQSRHAEMLAQLRAHTVYQWCDSYLTALGAARPMALSGRAPRQGRLGQPRLPETFACGP